MARPSKILTKEDLLRAMKITKSNMHAARHLHVSYTHYKKYAKLYKNDEGVSFLDLHKNQQGKGITKYSQKKLPKFTAILNGDVPPKHLDREEFKQRLIFEALIEEKCTKCGFAERRIKDTQVPLAINYKDANLNRILALKKKFNKYTIGYSDHCKNFEASVFALNLGAKIIKRPLEFSGDNATSESALIHFAENVNFDILVFIQCTAPLIKSKDINQGLKNIKEFDSMVSVSETHQMFWDANGPLYDINNRARRQDSTKKYLETGSFFITSKKNLLKHKNRLSGNIGFVEIPKYRSFDIDCYDDIKIVEAIINSKKYNDE